jgi:hypothetical protein
MTPIDYSKYSKVDIQSAFASIDKEKYPENYAALVAEMKKRKIRRKVGTWEILGNTRVRYTPLNYLILIALEAYAIYGAFLGKLYFPGKKGGYTFHGTSVKIALLGISVFVASGLYYMIRQDEILKFRHKKEGFWTIFSISIGIMVWAILANE